MRVALLLVLCLPACGSPLFCDEDTQTVDVRTNDPYRDLSQRNVEMLRDRGYDCEGEPLYDAFGNVIGTRYTCMGCS